MRTLALWTLLALQLTFNGWVVWKETRPPAGFNAFGDPHVIESWTSQHLGEGVIIRTEQCSGRVEVYSAREARWVALR